MCACWFIFGSTQNVFLTPTLNMHINFDIRGFPWFNLNALVTNWTCWDYILSFYFICSVFVFKLWRIYLISKNAITHSKMNENRTICSDLMDVQLREACDRWLRQNSNPQSSHLNGRKSKQIHKRLLIQTENTKKIVNIPNCWHSATWQCDPFATSIILSLRIIQCSFYNFNCIFLHSCLLQVHHLQLYINHLSIYFYFV